MGEMIKKLIPYRQRRGVMPVNQKKIAFGGRGGSGAKQPEGKREAGPALLTQVVPKWSGATHAGKTIGC